MRTLRDLLRTWEDWSAREVSRRALAKATTERHREVLRGALDQRDEVSPLDVLCDTAELMSLLTSWRWQVVHAARAAGASWDQIGNSIGASAESAESEYVTALAAQVRCRGAIGREGCSDQAL